MSKKKNFFITALATATILSSSIISTFAVSEDDIWSLYYIKSSVLNPYSDYSEYTVLDVLEMKHDILYNPQLTYMPNGILEANSWVDLVSTVTASYCATNPVYASGGWVYDYDILGNTYTSDACCTTIVNLAWSVLNLGVYCNSASYENDLDVRSTLESVGFTYKTLDELTDEDWENLTPGTIFCTDGTGTGFGPHTEIFMGWIENSKSGGAYCYDGGKGALGDPSTNSQNARNYYSSWTEGCSTVAPGVKPYYNKTYMENWFHAVYIPCGEYTGSYGN